MVRLSERIFDLARTWLHVLGDLVSYIWKQMQTQEVHDLLLEMESAISNPDGTGNVPPTGNPGKPIVPPANPQPLSRLADSPQSLAFDALGRQ